MDSYEKPSGGDDRAFERALFDAGRLDRASPDVTLAWARFSGALAMVPTATGEHASVGAADASATAASVAQVGAGLVRLQIAKWLLVGALGGSALTLLGMHLWPRAVHVRTVVSAEAVQPVADGSVSAPSPFVATPSAALLDVPEPTLEPHSESRPIRSHRPSASPLIVGLPVDQRAVAAAVNPDPIVAPGPRSTLREQVALIDAARSALSAGQIDETLRWTDRFHSEFPSGELAPEAEVVVIEALSLRGDLTLLRARGERFLSRYPGDPHAAKVRSLSRRPPSATAD